MREEGVCVGGGTLYVGVCNCVCIYIDQLLTNLP